MINYDYDKVSSNLFIVDNFIELRIHWKIK